ncbi:MAG: hypothetical protein HUU34_00215 [Saprospiraceae bacterium]|nr:hypothetical protein [Saprospiraceae bacterium]
MNYRPPLSAVLAAWLCWLPNTGVAGVHNGTAADSSLYRLVRCLHQDVLTITKHYEQQVSALDLQLRATEALLENAENSRVLKKSHFLALLQKVRLLEKGQQLNENYQLSLTETRFRKGLELIKLLYEKILGLDHHFTSMQTYQQVMLLSNPNTFPEFQQTKRLLESRLRKKSALKLPGLLDTNPFLSAAFSLVASVVGDGAPAEKEKDLDQISCMLDFTVRMGNDLNLIYYETEFLRKSNCSLTADCMLLFADYVKPLGYQIPLDVCRKADDWETVYGALEAFSLKLETLKAKADEPSRREAYKYQTDLEFSVDRLLDFINKYAAFIAQGEKYYQKFQIIAGSYANEEVCGARLPPQFNDLKTEISRSIEKFNESYNIAELKGSKLKDLLYGAGN